VRELHVERFGDFDRPARAQDRAATRLLLGLGKARRLDETVAASGIRATVLGDPARGTLLQTLRSYADADMNVQKAAAQLAIHPNTMYARLERIREVTGLDAQRYHELTELLLGSECRLR
jgi:sugar diacid utilization regulator